MAAATAVGHGVERAVRTAGFGLNASVWAGAARAPAPDEERQFAQLLLRFRFRVVASVRLSAAGRSSWTRLDNHG
jgi:hypothetical protein